LVERTAHNGFVVGSNPTKPILINTIIKMQLNLKNYQISQTKKYLKKNNFFTFIVPFSKIHKMVIVEQELKN
jgi:hypothetical protein